MHSPLSKWVSLYTKSSRSGDYNYGRGSTSSIFHRCCQVLSKFASKKGCLMTVFRATLPHSRGQKLNCLLRTFDKLRLQLSFDRLQTVHQTYQRPIYLFARDPRRNFFVPFKIGSVENSVVFLTDKSKLMGYSSCQVYKRKFLCFIPQTTFNGLKLVSVPPPGILIGTMKRTSIGGIASLTNEEQPSQVGFLTRFRPDGFVTCLI